MPGKDADRMPITAHLEELRRRIVYSAIVLSVAFIVLFNYSGAVLEWLKLPLTMTVHIKLAYPFFFATYTQNSVPLYFTSPTEPLWMFMKIAFVAGIFVSMPFILTQLWLFISPGLLPKERRYALPFVVSASSMFIIGGLFCQYFILPFAVKFLIGFGNEFGSDLQPILTIGNYVDLCAKLMLAFGLIFQMPLIIMLLARMGIVTPQFLARNRKYAVLINFILAAVLTPTPDAFNMMLMAIPMIVLYEVGIILARIMVKNRDKAMEEPEAGSED
jgi:sec-independent protein translocase protein TatC